MPVFVQQSKIIPNLGGSKKLSLEKLNCDCQAFYGNLIALAIKIGTSTLG